MEEENLPSLPTLQPEILVHIFHKLPIKSIYKCKLVCNEWSSLISDPFFKSNYDPSFLLNQPLNLMMIPSPMCHNRNRHKNIPALSYEIDNRSDTSLVGRPQPLPSNFTSRNRLSVLGSWNGLVALYRHPGDVCLFNPYVAGEEIVVHVPIVEDRWYSLVYGHLFGLCHDVVTDEYKAVICEANYFCTQGSYLVSFKEGSWKFKTIPEKDEQDFYCPNGSSVTGTIVKGVSYRICSVLGSDDSIFYFDLKTEEFMMAPKVPNGKRISGLGTLDGQLTTSVKTDGGLEVWSLKECGNGDCSWSVLFVVANKLRSLRTLWWVIKDVEVLIDVNGEQLMIYDIENRSLRQLQRKRRRSLYNIVAYIPTLISLM